jgi:hypothetical protein
MPELGGRTLVILPFSKTTYNINNENNWGFTSPKN